MNNNHESKFINGLFLGALIGGAAVFLMGTKTGRNLVKIVSEQGLEGLTDLLEEYDLSSMEEAELDESEDQIDIKSDEESTNHVVDSGDEKKHSDEGSITPAKKRFFKRK